MIAALVVGLGIAAPLGVLAAAVLHRLQREHREVADRAHQLEVLATEKAHLALHDPLTGLPNRVEFRDQVAAALSVAEAVGRRAVVMLLDVDRFREINDTLGHYNGDRVLQELATRLVAAVEGAATVARLGGDEFGVLMETELALADAVAEGRRILAAVGETVTIDDLSLHVEISMGVALYPEHGEDVDLLLQRADVALYVTKAAQSGVEAYSARKDGYRPSRLALMGELRRALEGDELVLDYQPQLDLRTGTVHSVEALLRWEHPTRGLVMPAEFIPLAERTGLIRPLTLQALELACRQWAEWRKEGRSLQVAVNLSARHLHDPDLAGELSRLLWRWRVPPAQLMLEITESAVLGELGRAKDLLPKLSAMGVRLALDDFGTGYSSLTYLKEMPVNQVKIDRSFVQHMTSDPTDAAIVRATIELAHNLGLEVVAEGAESETTCELLGSFHCDLAQGWWLSRALPARDLMEWLDHHPERPTGIDQWVATVRG
ncbi:MAG TPA: EAL domain-containing protein [Actinomycetota bacterium]|nr:EAL domain-containing protein [Actinomycetota bacterium]